MDADEDDEWEPPLGILPASGPADHDHTQEVDPADDKLEYVDDPAAQLVELQSVLPASRHPVPPALSDPNIPEGMYSDVRDSLRI